MEVQKELAKNNPKVKAKLTAFSRITKDMQRRAISQEDARRAKDHVRDRFYDALRSRISLLRSFLNKYLLRKCMNIAASPE